MKGCRAQMFCIQLFMIKQRNTQMIDAIVLKPFAGLEEGRITQLKEFEFERLLADGFVKKVDEVKKKVEISSDKKAFKK